VLKGPIASLSLFIAQRTTPCQGQLQTVTKTTKGMRHSFMRTSQFTTQEIRRHYYINGMILMAQYTQRTIVQLLQCKHHKNSIQVYMIFLAKGAMINDDCISISHQPITNSHYNQLYCTHCIPEQVFI